MSAIKAFEGLGHLEWKNANYRYSLTVLKAFRLLRIRRRLKFQAISFHEKHMAHIVYLDETGQEKVLKTRWLAVDPIKKVAKAIEEHDKQDSSVPSVE